MRIRARTAMMLCVVVLAFIVLTTRAQTGGAQQDLVGRFCEMDVKGKQLYPDGQKDIASLLQFQGPRNRFSEITVVKDYVVHSPEIQGDTAKSSVDYTDLIPSFRTKLSMISDEEKGNGDVERTRDFRPDSHHPVGCGIPLRLRSGQALRGSRWWESDEEPAIHSAIRFYCP